MCALVTGVQTCALPILLGDGRLPAVLLPLRGQIVVAHEELRNAGELKDAAKRPEQKNSIAARKISARRAVIGHEHRVADEHHIADHISNTSWRTTGNMEHGNWQFANCDTVAIGPEKIEIRAITAKFGSGVEDVAEYSLNVPDMLADRDRAAEPFLDPSCCREMIGMRVGLQKPVDRDALGADILHDRLDRTSAV